MDKWMSLMEKCEYRKSATEAEVYRKKGNNYYLHKDSWKALEFYSKSVLWAPPGTEGLALAFGNRSAVLLELEYFEECMRDINRCFATKLFPEVSVHKLYSRKLRCLAKLGPQGCKLKKEIESLAEYIAKVDLEAATKEKVLKEAEALISQNKKYKISYDWVDQSRTQLVELKFANSEVPNVSSRVRLEYSDSQGRYFEADKDISPGEVVLVEKPFAAVLLPHCYDTYCHHCQISLPRDFVPCLECAQVRYCCESCRDAAWGSFHWFECGWLDLFHQMGLAHLALRMVLMVQLQQIIKFCFCAHTLDTALTNVGYFGGNGEVYTSGYESAFNLVAHDSHISAEDLKTYERVADVLVRCLKAKKYFRRLKKFIGGAVNICMECKMAFDTERPSNGSTEAENGTTSDRQTSLIGPSASNKLMERCMKSLLVRHLKLLICNAHTVTGVIRLDMKMTAAQSLNATWEKTAAAIRQYMATADGTKSIGGPPSQLAPVDQTNQIKIASALFPVASLMNHSCDPNTYSSFVGNTIVVRAVREIRSGEQIYTCYGPHVGRMLKNDRVSLLRQQYRFVCQCPACSEDCDKELLYNAYKCCTCGGAVLLVDQNDHPQEEPTMGICSSCKSLRPVDPKKVLNLLDSFDDDHPKILGYTLDGNALHKRLCQLEGLLYRDNKRLSEARDYVSRVLAEEGSYEIASSILTRNIATNSFYYGGASIEIGNEFLKLIDVEVAALQQKLDDEDKLSADMVTKIKEHIAAATAIFTVFLGPNCPQIEELEEKKKVFTLVD